MGLLVQVLADAPYSQALSAAAPTLSERSLPRGIIRTLFSSTVCCRSELFDVQPAPWDYQFKHWPAHLILRYFPLLLRPYRSATCPMGLLVQVLADAPYSQVLSAAAPTLSIAACPVGVTYWYRYLLTHLTLRYLPLLLRPIGVQPALWDY